MQDFLIHFAYVGIVIALVGRGVGLPLPEDISLLTIGFLCAQGICELDIVLPLAWVCIVLADSLSFFGGRVFGHHLPRFPLLRWVITHAHLEEAERFYEKHGIKALLAARILPGFRSPLFFIAGTSGVPLSRFLLIDALVAPLNVGVLILLGWYFPKKLSMMQDATNTVQLVVVLVVAVFIGILILRRRQLKKLAREENENPPAPD